MQIITLTALLIFTTSGAFLNSSRQLSLPAKLYFSFKVRNEFDFCMLIYPIFPQNVLRLLLRGTRMSVSSNCVFSSP